MKTFIFSLITWGILTYLNPLGAETLTVLSNQAFTDPKQPQVIFYHDEHNEKAGIDNCEACHHVYDDMGPVDGETSEGSPCSDCHEAVHFGDGITLATAFHKRCKGCHLEVKQGPVMCGQCHIDNSAAIGYVN
ncbi:MAG: cytochrome c family protein [Proteobacteria bacterium]|nr:cytochrome c family protein [Pseudomonadota bacterium]